ncbi:MAG: helix-turn-helix domain-containing protein [Pseudomonadota bacterium]
MTALHVIETETARRADHLHALRSVPEGATLFREADPVTHLFELRTGVLRLTRVLETGRRQVVAFAHPGDVVGFPAGGLHHCDCEALTPATLAVHRRAALEGGGTDPALHRRLQAAALREIAALQDHLLLLARKGARGKLASFLLNMIDAHGQARGGHAVLELEMPRADIGDYLCMTVETVSRTLTQMRAAGIIRLDGCQRIVLLDREGLMEMAGAE